MYHLANLCQINQRILYYKAINIIVIVSNNIICGLLIVKETTQKQNILVLITKLHKTRTWQSSCE